MQQLVAFALHHLAHRDARPAAYHIGNVFCGYLFFHHGFGALCLYKLVLHILDVLLQCLQFSVTDFCHTSIVAFPFGFFCLEFQILNLLLVLLYAVQQLFFALPFGLEVLFLFLQFGNVAVQLLQLFGIVLAFDGFALNLKLFQPSAYFIQLFRDRITLHTQLGGSFVHQVNGLVRKETLRDVAVAQFYGSYDGVVLNANSVMIFITLLQSAQNADAAQYVGFVHHYRLETAFKRLVLLEIFLILVKSGGTDASQFSSGQCWLQNIRSVHCALAFTCAYKGVNFVNEENDAAFAFSHFVYHAFQSLLKFSFVLCAGNERTHVQTEKLLVAQIFWHVAA